MSMQIKTDVPENILESSFDSFSHLVELTDEDKKFGINWRQKYFILSLILDSLDLDANNEFILGCLSQPEKELVVACAGSGKTTMAHVKIIFIKIMNKIYEAFSRERGETYAPLTGSNVLFLVYNTHNVAPVEQTHAKYCALINAKDITLKFGDIVLKVQIDLNLDVMTFHSLARKWYVDYSNWFGTYGFTLTESEAAFEKIMSNVSQVTCRKDGLEYRRFPADRLYLAYVMMKEKMIKPEDLVNSSFAELCPRACLSEMPTEVLMKIFNAFDKAKKNRKIYGFTDFLVGFNELLTHHPEARERIKNRYDYIVADEYQDFNLIMIETLKLLVGDKGLFCIGDDDQAIYGFRGVEVTNILSFTDFFPNGKVYTLSVNRRCAREIVNAASEIVTGNNIRFNKSVKPRREGGMIKWAPYSSEAGCAKHVVSRISKMTPEDQSKAVLCFKNRAQSSIVCYELYKAGIPFHVTNGFMPFDHIVFRDFWNAIQLLAYPTQRIYHRYISYVSCIGLHEANQIMSWDPYRKIYTKPMNSNMHFLMEDWGKFKENPKFVQELRILMDISKKMATDEPMENYIMPLVNLYLKNHIDWREVEDGFEKETFAYFTEQLGVYFSSHLSWRQFFKEHEEKKDRLNSWTQEGRGVLLSTFHGLKGLEKDVVIAIGLDDAIYPAFAQIEEQNESLDEIELLKEEEVRLFYVLLTRAKNKVYLYYKKDRPSEMVMKLMRSEDRWRTKEDLTLELDSAPKSVVFNESNDKVDSIRNRFAAVFR